MKLRYYLDRDGEPIDMSGCECDERGVCTNPWCQMQADMIAQDFRKIYNGRVLAGLHGPEAVIA